MRNDHCSLSYRQTGAFSKMALDYVAGAAALQPFFRHPVSDAGLLAAMEARQLFDTPRQVLHEVLQQQYAHIGLNTRQQAHVDALLHADCFTIVTAHQPNIFTGPLYFIYKILHAIRLAAYCAEKWPDRHFVPVYYMGSEDADLDELGYIVAGGQKLRWNTQQAGAVGRMKTEGLADIINTLRGQFGFLPHGAEMVAILEKAYLQAPNIQEATLQLVNTLFADMGLLVLIPDHPKLKAAYAPVMRRELQEQFSSKIVAATIDRLRDAYKVQAAGRDINLFYLFDDGRRERIEQTPNGYRVLFSNVYFTEAEILAELEQHPERFSPNVILRGMLQETILPNIAFVGGGGELAYWLELKDLFDATGVPYPLLVLRNSFLLVDETSAKWQQKLGLDAEGLFLPLQQQEDMLVERLHGRIPDTHSAQQQLLALYEQLKQDAAAVDFTLLQHVGALHARAEKGLQGLAKKMQRAGRRKIKEQSAQLEKLKERLFPLDNLQERVENFMPYYAAYGPGLLQQLYEKSPALSQEFTVVYLD